MRVSDFFDVPEEIKRYILELEYILFDTEKLNDRELLLKIEFSNILIFGIYLLKNARRGKEFIKEGLKAFLEAIEEFEERHKIYFKEFLIYILEVGRVDEEELESMLLKEGGERVRSVVEKWIDKWIEQGIQQGIILDAQDMVLSAIEVKLGHVPKYIEERIKNITDREKLKNLFREIVKAQEVNLSFLNLLLSN